MSRTIYDRFTESEIAAYHEGQQDALKFRANQGDIYQELFKAETVAHQIFITYDDVNDGVVLRVTFKERHDKDGCPITAYVGKGRHPSVMARALDFLARHPHHRPYCNVDY